MDMMDHAGWIIVASLVSMGVGGWLHWLIRKDNCKNCGIDDLRTDINGMCNLVRELAARAGISVKEQLEIESLQKG
ncbi:MAG: hypothetical protein WB930_00080 [Syntrophobacteraceae bacterium]